MKSDRGERVDDDENRPDTLSDRPDTLREGAAER
eukprot:CAMPEP_0198350342 /NCGR_PEP_ID=MMETSP1450-20131203/98407_1 /TAXON_ID=753684 ORGANISM="Madagascaria erythrocladiodes, Strain CCMP3234" /NCGR_SAMPLE_ID=MMETSP1450 /ASSEMBLY_ACC=CAM_ASM_001115 /LENGTH=33 /DNA_ID= /DNA_START= /DNA_END= /DNA_ORIENTATION=